MTAPSTRSRRSYRSPRRQQQAAQTRELVLSAATRLFGTRGWAATGMRDVAREAGVAVETVYANFRSKSDLLMGAIDVNVVGDAEPVPLAQRPEFAALSTGSFTERINATARLVTDINRRTSGLRRALAEAAVSEPALAEQLALGDNRRRADVQRAAELITGRRIEPAETDGLWAITSIEVFHLLTGSAGCSTGSYTDWVAKMIGLVLTDGSEQEGRS